MNEDQKADSLFIWIMVGIVVLVLTIDLVGRYNAERIKKEKERVLENALEEFLENLEAQ